MLSFFRDGSRITQLNGYGRNAVKITFEGQENLTPFRYITGNQQTGKQAAEEASFNAGDALTLVDIGNNIQGASDNAPKHTLLAGAQRDSLMQESGVLSDYRVVMAHTLSGEDLRRANEEGFDLKNMSPEESVTILDKVKAEMAKGGTVIRGYNDDLDGGILEDAGNAGLKQMITKALESQDLPVTDENISAVQNAVTLAGELDKPTESRIAYMIENDLGTTVRDFYVAKSAAPDKFFTGGSVQDLDSPGMKYVRESMIEAGRVLADPEEGYRKAEWLFDRNLPVTPENILKEKEISGIAFPVSAVESAYAAARAIAGGKDAADGDLGSIGSVYERAAELYEEYFSDDKMTAGDIALQRKVQEIRLSMTAEVNVELIRSGFAIDTAPIEELLNELKIAEQAVALKYFPETAGVTAHGDNAPGMSIGSPEDAVKAYRLYNEVTSSVREISASPASSLGVFIQRTPAEVAFREFEEIALGEKDRLRRAGESYEALMTEVRTDLGDSIRKAFGSVDGIVGGLGLELNDENRRHVRILAYNHTEMTAENMEKIAEADRLVTGVIGKMKPAAVLDMIRNGVNPLERTFEEIEAFLDRRNGEESGYGKASEDYAQFLYSLDRKKEITAEERESFIGIYRMIDKIERRDGAAIGAVLETGAALQFSNLLTAVRSSGFKGMDVKVDENTGLAEIARYGRSITDQIMSSFTKESREYYEEQAAQIRQAAQSGKDAAAFAAKAGVPDSYENIIASENLLSSEDDLYRTLFGGKEKKQLLRGESDRLKELASGMMDDIAEAEDGAEVYSDILDEFRAVTEEMTIGADSVIDVRAMQQINRQLSVAVKAAEEGNEEYFVPVEIEGELTKVRLSFRKSEDGTAGTDITFRTPDEGTCTAHFETDGKAVRGFISTGPDFEVKKIVSAVDIFTAELKNRDLDVTDIRILTAEVSAGTYSISGKEAGEDRQEGAGRRELFGISRDFLKAVKESFYED